MNTPKPQHQFVKRRRDSHGRIYGEMVTGQLIRLEPARPWRGKSERRRVIRRRNLLRKLTAIHAAISQP